MYGPAVPDYKSPEEVAEGIAPAGSGLSPLAVLIGDLDHRPVRVAKFPGTGTDYALWVLTDEENRLAAEAAYLYVTKTCKLPFDYAERTGLVDRENRVQVLARAMRRPRTPIAPFSHVNPDSAANEVRKLSADVQDAILAEYVQHVDARSPFAKLDPHGFDAQVEALIETLGKGVPADALLSPFDTATLREIVVHLVDRLRASTKPEGSGSSSPSAGASTSTALPAAGPAPTDAPSPPSPPSSPAPRSVTPDAPPGAVKPPL